MSLEREFQAWVISTAQVLGWRVWHTPTPMRPIGGNRFVPDPRGAGLPDLTMIHRTRSRMIFAEIKDHDGKLSEGQVEFTQLAAKVAKAITEVVDGLECAEPGTTAPTPLLAVYVWRPGAEELIESILRGVPS